MAMSSIDQIAKIAVCNARPTCFPAHDESAITEGTVQLLCMMYTVPMKKPKMSSRLHRPVKHEVLCSGTDPTSVKPSKSMNTTTKKMMAEYVLASCTVLLCIRGLMNSVARMIDTMAVCKSLETQSAMHSGQVVSLICIAMHSWLGQALEVHSLHKS